MRDDSIQHEESTEPGVLSGLNRRGFLATAGMLGLFGAAGGVVADDVTIENVGELQERLQFLEFGLPFGITPAHVAAGVRRETGDIKLEIVELFTKCGDFVKGTLRGEMWLTSHRLDTVVPELGRDLERLRKAPIMEHFRKQRSLNRHARSE